MNAAAPDTDITALLLAWRRGDRAALERAMPQLYELLRRIAVQRLDGDAAGRTLNPTELVQEAVARLLGSRKGFDNRQHFLAVGALYMRSILIDRARAIRADRRNGFELTITLGAAANVGDDAGDMDLVILDAALRQLEAQDPRAAQVLELFNFAGMTRERIAEVVGISVPTVDRDLRFGRAWINRAMA